MKYFVPFTMVLFLGSLFIAGQALGVENGAVQSPAFQGQSPPEGQTTPHDTMGQRGSMQQEQITLEQLDSEKVQKLQQALQDNGADPGQIDGVAGQETRDAIREFQQDEWISASGQLDRETLEALDLDAQEFMGVSPAFGQTQQRQDRDLDERLGLDDQQREERVGVQPRDQQQIGAQDRQRMGAQDQAAQRLNSNQVRELQQALQEKGADPGPVDGIMGPLTQEGIREFQQDEGIAATGQLNRETLEALDLDAQEFLGVAPQFEEQSEPRMEMERERETDLPREGTEQRDMQQPGTMGR